MENAKIRPIATLKPLNGSLPKLARLIGSWTAPNMHNFVAIGLGVFALQIRVFAMPFDVTIVCLFFWVLQ